MKKCGKIQAELSAYIDNELPTAARLMVEEHVRGCRNCQERLAGLETLTTGVIALARLQPGPEFLAGVRRQIAREAKPQPKAWQDYLLRPVWLKIPMEAAAVVAIVLFVTRVERSVNKRVPGRDEAIMRAEKPVSAPAVAGGEPRRIDKLAPNRPVGSAVPSETNLTTTGFQPAAPAEVVVVYAKDFDDVQSRARQLAAAMNGRIVPPPDGKTTTRALFVELPPENVESFKSRLLQGTRRVNAEARNHPATASNLSSGAVGGLESKAATTVLKIQVVPPAN